MTIVPQTDAELRQLAAEIYAFDGGITILEQFHTWAVTPFGLECLTHQYSIPYEQLANRRHDWPRHMREKRWCVMVDFEAAYEEAVYRYFHGHANRLLRRRMAA